MICSQCHTSNDDNASICCMCGNDLSPMTVVLAGQNGADGISVTVPPEGCKIGRQDGFETEKLFCNEWAEYIGRHHCEIFFRDGDCYIRPLKTTNPTYVIGLFKSVPLPPYDEFKLAEGTTIAFGSEEFAFTVHMERTVIETAKEEAKAEIFEMGWFITCPHCKERHPVDTEDDTVKRCIDCDEDISYVSARHERV